MGPKIEIPSGSPFTIHNIPFGVVSTQSDNKPRCATAIGARVIDLAAYAKQGHFDYLNLTPEPARVFNQSSLNLFAAQQRSYRSAVRKSLIEKISQSEIPESCLIPLDTTIMHLPMHIGGYSDFYCSLEHVQNCSPMAVGASIPQNWFYAPSVYNGRASSVIPSPQPVRRPRGVYNNANGKPEYGPSQQMDFELEMGFFISKPIDHGTEMNIDAAEEHIFGFVLLNDWSSRDLQLFEMKPLGPFHGKGFGTSISPWIVTLDALQPFRCAPKTKQDPAPFPHLTWKNEKDATIDIKLKVSLIRDGKHTDIATSNLRYLYWTPFQQLAHHASAMCGMKTGDLIGTGTISGDGTNENGEKIELGCLYEGTQGGSKDMVLPDQSRMRYLNDGDEVIMQAWCGGASVGDITLGFGECRGVILPAFR